MANVYDELLRFGKPPPPILEALDGKPSSYDVDGEWTPHYQGHPRCNVKGAFDDKAFLGGVQAIAYLAAMLPVGAPRRRALVALHHKIEARLDNPALLCFGGFDLEDTMPATDAIVTDSNYAYFRPARLRAPEDIACLDRMTKFSWPTGPYPWSSQFPVWKVWSSVGFSQIVERLAKTPVPDGRWEIDPRASVPELVERMRDLHDLSEDAAALFLQLLTLADCADRVLAEVNGFPPARYNAATAELVAKTLVAEKKQPRATRKCVLPGTWETLKPPNPALETWKLPLYDASMEDQNVRAPLGRIVPLRPIHVLFAEAFARHEAEAPGAKQRRRAAPAVTATRNWMSEIAAHPDDDALRLVYADWLSDHGDPRGELISLQVQRPELRAEANALVAQHRAAWTEAIHPFVKAVRFERGFIVGVTAHAPTFVKNARLIFEACPLLYELTLDAGPVGPVPAAHWRALVGSEYFARMTHLDTTSDHYVADNRDFMLLLDSPNCPRLKHLRLGYHRTNDGLGTFTMVIAQHEKLTDLRFLEYPGQKCGPRSYRALLESKVLTKLETLRLPFNGITDKQARALLEPLRNGLAPSLRKLDFSNTIDSTFITAAVDRFARNTVGEETAREIDQCLAARS